MSKMLVLWLALLGLASPATATDPLGFWADPQRGANSFNRMPPSQAYFDALAATGATWVRLAYDKWPSRGRDFLIGNADHYQGLVQADLACLRAVLDRAHKAGLKVVLTPLSLPLMRWAQNNDGRFDDRLWQAPANWEAATRFWRDLARALKGHPAVAAYNLINEPAPERDGGLAEHAPAAEMRAWYQEQQGSGRDLRAFYQTLISAVRSQDVRMPIMLDAGWYAAADGFAYWPGALGDGRILYSVHMYEPYQMTSDPASLKRLALAYPGMAPFGASQEYWNRERVAAYLGNFTRWAEQAGLPASRLVFGEFGCLRRWPGCASYLEDVLDVAERSGVHWAFYAFREDAWDGMDYELGSAPVPWEYWQAAEAGRPDPVQRHGSALFDVIGRYLQGSLKPAQSAP